MGSSEFVMAATKQKAATLIKEEAKKQLEEALKSTKK